MIKNLPDNWATAKLGAVCKTTSGGTPSRKREDYFQGDIPWVKSGELPDGPVCEIEEYITQEAVKNSSAKLFPSGSLLVAMYGATVGKLGILNHDATTNQAVCAIFPTKVVDTKYLFWYLRYVRSDLIAQAIGGAQPNVNQGILRELEIPIAPFEQQKRIVAEIEKQFSRLDEAVANLKRVKANLKRYKAAVLKAAVEGKLSEDLPCRQAGWRDPSFRNISDKRVPEKCNAYFAYVLECDDGLLYKGFSQDLYARINLHLSGRGAKWTKEHKPVALIHFEEYSSEKEAVEREKYFKSGSGREWINGLRNQQKKKHEPAAKLLERILTERRKKWEEAELDKMKAKGKTPKDDKWKKKYKVPDELLFEGVPQIPKNWHWTTLDTLLREPLKNGHSAKASSTGKGIRTLTLTAVTEGDFSEKNTKITVATESKAKGLWLEPGDILIERSNAPELVGTAKVFWGPTNYAIYPDLIIRARTIEKANPSYIEMVLSSDRVRLYFKSRAKGISGSMPKINQDIIKHVAVPLPPQVEQIKIIEEVNSYFSFIESLKTESLSNLRRAERLRKSILQKAFSGQLIEPKEKGEA